MHLNTLTRHHIGSEQNKSSTNAYMLDKSTQLFLFALRLKNKLKKHVDKTMLRAHFYSLRFALPDIVAFECEPRTQLVVVAPPLCILDNVWR